MTRVLAAVDESPVGTTVRRAAAVLAKTLGTDVEPVQVENDNVARVLVDAGDDPDVCCLAVGVRATASGRRPAGHVAQEVLETSRVPVLAVPPGCRLPRRGATFGRALVPLAAEETRVAAVGPIVDALESNGVEIVTLHVIEPERAPAFLDQPHHGAEAWVTSFRRRFHQRSDADLRVRVGDAATLVVNAAGELEADLTVLSWSQRLTPYRAAVVRGALDRSDIPVLLVPS